METLLQYLIDMDSRIFLSINGMHAPYWDSFMFLVSGKVIWIPLYATLLFVLLRNFSYVVVLKILLAIGLVILFTDTLTSQVIRPAVGRLRPSNLENSICGMVHIVDGVRGGRYGFPSAHAGNCFGLSFFICYLLRRTWLSVFMIVWALLVCYSRMYGTGHLWRHRCRFHFLSRMTIEPIARFESPFRSKFGIPKQSGLVEELEGRIVFEPKFRNADALRGMEGFDYLWLIWSFSANSHQAVSPVVRPPLLGGNEKMGVFATRSPFRPNGIGLSCVRLDHVEWETPRGPVIVVKGADLMDGTPIFDIKPYVVYADCKPQARSGFVDTTPIERLRVVVPEALRAKLGEKEARVLTQVLSLDPRPHYQNDPQKTYGMPFAGRDVKFRVENGVLTVVDLVDESL